MRKEVVDALAKVPNELSIEPLIEALKDKNGEVRLRAVEAMYAIGNERAIPNLIWIEENDFYVCEGPLTNSQMAAKAIEQINQRYKIGQ